jgi:hypothetical protein
MVGAHQEIGWDLPLRQPACVLDRRHRGLYVVDGDIVAQYIDHGHDVCVDTGGAQVRHTRIVAAVIYFIDDPTGHRLGDLRLHGT